MIKILPGFRTVHYTGVIYVMDKAASLGYHPSNPDWINLGQGAPETGTIANAPARINQLHIDFAEHEYAHVMGQKALRQKIADLYNHLYRRNKLSKYTWENVSISGGGRIALARIAAALGNINMGHFLPDYTAYEELLSVFKAFVPIPILLEAENQYEISAAHIEKEILGRGLQALLISNPCNPTGQVLAGEKLKTWVTLARRLHCSMIFDEFYSHYIYGQTNNDMPTMISAAEYIDDVDEDPVVIVDGLTKNWRYPGWRISWTLAPKEVIHTIASVGSFLDGGANHPFQTQALSLLDIEHTIAETKALQACFLEKRDYVLKRLANMNIQVDAKPQGTFYIWANLSNLPAPLNDGLQFFEAGLKEKFITVPGIFFDVNPDKRRTHARYRHYTRISFGPEMEVLKRGLDAMEKMIGRYQSLTAVAT